MALTCRVQYLNDIDPFSYTTNFPDPARPPLHTFSLTLPLINQLAAIHRLLKSPHRLDDAALQLYKDGDYGSYLDLEASISEQQEEFEGFQSNKKNSIVLRTQLSVRVHTIIEKLLTSEGRELRRALFSLKQIFQEDKDLVHEFVQNDGLSCLIKVGSEADQNYQNYILRALGQVMLYVDGMNGVMEHNQTIQWLYSLISSKFRLVVKTALKLLLVFVEYTESNCMLLIKAIRSVDYSQGVFPYHNIMKLLKDFESADTELLIYAMTLINKILGGVPDQDTYYDQSDALEEQDLESVIQRYMSKPGTDLDLLQQFQIYEAVLQYEDGDETTTPIRHLDESLRKTIRNRKSVVESAERRKSRRHSTGNTPGMIRNNLILQTNREDEDDESSSSQSSGINNTQLNGSYKDNNKAYEAGVTPALKRRRERAERQRSFMKEQESTGFFRNCLLHEGKNENENGNYQFQQRISNGTSIMRNSSRKDLTPLMNAVNKLDSDEKQPWIYSVIQNQEKLDEIENGNDNERNVLLQLKRENTVKDITQKLANQNILNSPSEEKINRIGDMSGLISKAKEGLAKSKSKIEIIKSPTNENLAKTEAKKSENELRWEELTASLNRSLNLCDMDFTDLGSDDEVDILAPVTVSNGIPPPPPPLKDICTAPPPPPRVAPLAPAPPTFNLQRTCKTAETKIPIKKNKKTVKLFWKEVRDDPITHLKLKTGFIWDELSPVNVDTQKLEHLFESRAKDLITKIGAITRASKIDFDELALNIQRLESDCKASWDHLKLIAKHDGSTMMKVKMSDFLSDCAERIILLGIVHRRIINRFHKFLLWLGIPIHQISDTKPNEFCRIVSEFALEYRTTRERVLQQLEKKANHRERNKTRGKMITDVGKFRSKEDRADAELRQLLGSDMSDVESLQGTLPWRRTRKDGNRSFLSPGNGNLTDGDDELIETLVKTATKAPSTRTAPRERKRTRHADRKSLRRTLKNGLSEEEKNHLSAFIKGY
ncbi:FH1/FH2 domain-containing protein 3 isoform X11 [Diorhabda carinulata]|uniref:FH1/FH2 domain-containing protein 3 isoform X11 n=1 Tax=Diorhabda carinulata TaxID=1163345 RepID=UPI0025A27D68|nr:FH1/FH2 domain-containing protein 3 isoform X11 [Diorhabda carinulata]